MAEGYTYRISIKSKDPSGYFFIVKTLKGYLKHFLGKDYTYVDLKINRPNITISNIYKGEMSSKAISDLLRFTIDKHISHKPNLSYALEEVVEKGKQPTLTSSNLELIGQVAQATVDIRTRLSELESTVLAYKVNEDGYIAEIDRLEGLVNSRTNEIESVKEQYDLLQFKYGELEKKFKTKSGNKEDAEKLRKEVLLFKRKLRQIGAIATKSVLGESKKLKVQGKSHYIKQAVLKGNSTFSQIVDYLNANNIEFSNSHIYHTLSHLVKNKELVREDIGIYKPLL